MDYQDTGSLERATDVGTSPTAIVRRWILELGLAHKREKEWRKSAAATLSKYRQEKVGRGSYNILWANTETLRPAIYNSPPAPDVRRRYRDDDPLGKAVAEVLRRAISYEIDTSDFDSVITNVCLDVLLPGRGIARVQYVPKFTPAEIAQPESEEPPGDTYSDGEIGGTEDADELAWEQSHIEHVQWDDFRLSAGREWDEVTWVAFRHRLTRDELCDQFGEAIGNAVELDATEDEDVKTQGNEKIAESFKTAEVWEIWDKDEKRVVFICAGHRASPLETLEDPLGLEGFFPTPRPLYAIEQSGSLVPIPLYEMYKEQAEELDRVSRRITTLVNGLKFRGVYDATITELAEVMRGEDNDLIPSANVSALIERGGLEKAIWMLPIERAAEVLNHLYMQREQIKSVIYEMTGISDILRGSTDAGETATAQQIKSHFGATRLRRMQAGVANYIRDLIRIQGEIVAEKFQPETLAGMSGLKYPTGAEKQQTMMQWQMQAMIAQHQGQQPPPKPNLPPSWDEIISVLRDDAQRTYKIDVETDSTISASIDTDMAALQQVLGGVTQLVQGLGPAVQMGALPVTALKELILAVVRRARLGNAVEDALEGIQQPPPPQAAHDNSAQIEAAKQQGAQQLEQMKQSHEAMLAQHKLQAEQAHEQLLAQREAEQTQLQHQIKQMELERDDALAAQKLQYEDQWRRLDADVKLAVAEIQRDTALTTQRATLNAQAGVTMDDAGQPMAGQTMADLGLSLQQSLDTALGVVNEQLGQILQENGRPKAVERGPDGRITSVGGRVVSRGPDGRVISVGDRAVVRDQAGRITAIN